MRNVRLKTVSETGGPLEQGIFAPSRGGRLRSLHTHRVVTAVDVQRRRGDVLRSVREQVRGSGGDVLGVDVAAERGPLLDDRLDRREAGDRARGERAHGTGGDCVDADVLLTQVPREILDRRVE